MGIRPDLLYHGSVHEIDGPIVPKQARDRARSRPNTRVGVYATEKKNVAIAVAICKCIDGISAVNLLNIDEDKPPGELWFGRLPQNRLIYLYTCRSDTFEMTGGQWVSSCPVLPVDRQTLRVSEHLHLIRVLGRWESASKLGRCYADRFRDRVNDLARYFTG